MKNGVTLEFAFDEELSRLIDEYLHQHRPVLLRGHNERWLFPGRQGGHKRPHQLGAQISRAVWKRTGLRLTAHQARHVAVALILDHHPGEFEFARRVLGHKQLKTTMKFYEGLGTLQATRRFAALVREGLFGSAKRDEVRP